MPGVFDEAKHPRDRHGEFSHVAERAVHAVDAIAGDAAGGDRTRPTGSHAPHLDTTSSVTGFVPHEGQTHATCRTGGEELPLSKFPTMSGGKRGTECRAHRDERRDALRAGKSTPTPVEVPVKPQPGQRRKPPTATELGIVPTPENPVPPITGMSRAVATDRHGNEFWTGAQVRLATGSGGVPWEVTGVQADGNVSVSRPHNRTGHYSGSIDKTVRADEVALHAHSPYQRPPQGDDSRVTHAEASELARQFLEREHGVTLPPVGTRVRGVSSLLDSSAGNPIEGRIGSYTRSLDGRSQVSLLKDGELGDRGHVAGWTHPKDVRPVGPPELPAAGQSDTIEHNPPHPFHGSREVRHNAGEVRMRDDLGDGSRMGRFTAPLNAGSVHFTLDGEQHGVALHPVVSSPGITTDETYTAEKAPDMHWNLADGVTVHREVEGRGKAARARYTVLDVRQQREQEQTYRHLPSPQEQVTAAEQRVEKARRDLYAALTEESRLDEIIRKRGSGGVGSGVIASQRRAAQDRRKAEDEQRAAQRELDGLRKAHGIEAPRDMSDAAVLARVNEALRDSENHHYSAGELDPEDLQQAIADAGTDRTVTVGVPSGYEMTLRRDDAEALLSLIEKRRRGYKDLGVSSGATGGPGVGTFSGGEVTVPGFAVVQRDAEPGSRSAELALRMLRRQHNARHGDDDARRARLDDLRRVYRRGYRTAKAGRGAAAVDRVRQHLSALAGDHGGPDPDLLPEKHPAHVKRERKSLVADAVALGRFTTGLTYTAGKTLLTLDAARAASGVETEEEARELLAEHVRQQEAIMAAAGAEQPPVAARLSTKAAPRAEIRERRPEETKADAVLGSVATPGQKPRLLYASGTDSDRLSWASGPETPADVDLDRKAGGRTITIDDDLVVALVAVTGVVDEVDDLPEPGCFDETLRLRIPKGVWSHDWDVWVSRTEAIEELMPGDARLPELTRLGDPWPREAGGLLVATRFNKGTSAGRDALSNVHFFDEGPLGPQTEWSIGYNVRPGRAYKTRDGVRHIRSWDVFEYGPVLFGAASLSGTLQLAGVKASAMRQDRRLRL